MLVVHGCATSEGSTRAGQCYNRPRVECEEACVKGRGRERLLFSRP